MIAHVCQTMGWTWDYTADNVDLPRLYQLTKYWKSNPPWQQMIAHHWGYGKTKSEDIRNNTAVPVADALPKHEFEQLLETFGLPIS